MLLLTRCLLDPWNNVYYMLPFLIALSAWEALRYSRAPLFGLIATFATWLVFEALPGEPRPMPAPRCSWCSRFPRSRRSGWRCGATERGGVAYRAAVSGTGGACR